MYTRTYIHVLRSCSPDDLQVPLFLFLLPLLLLRDQVTRISQDTRKQMSVTPFERSLRRRRDA